MVDATEILKPFGVDVVEAAKFFASRNNPKMKVPVREVVEKYIASRISNNASEIHVRTLQSRLDRFARDYDGWNIADFTVAIAQEWLDQMMNGSKAMSPQNKKNYRAACHALFHWATKHELCPENPFSKIEAPRIGERVVGIYAPSEMSRLLDAAQKLDRDLIPYLVFGGFAGLRPDEVACLRWEDFSPEDSNLVIRGDGEGSVRTRHIKLGEQCLAWIMPFAKHEGAVAAYGRWPYKRFEAVCKAAGVHWQKDGLRHSYASYRLAQGVSPIDVSNEMGNSSGILNKHYRNRHCKPSDAEKWFSIMPAAKGAKNLVFKTA